MSEAFFFEEGESEFLLFLFPHHKLVSFFIFPFFSVSCFIFFIFKVNLWF